MTLQFVSLILLPMDREVTVMTTLVKRNTLRELESEVTMVMMMETIELRAAKIILCKGNT